MFFLTCSAVNTSRRTKPCVLARAVVNNHLPGLPKLLSSQGYGLLGGGWRGLCESKLLQLRLRIGRKLLSRFVRWRYAVCRGIKSKVHISGLFGFSRHFFFLLSI